MSRDRRHFDDSPEERAARRAMRSISKKHGKHGRKDFQSNIREALAGGDIDSLDEFDDLFEDEEKFRRR
jgi:hypothetical protein